jgi:hypothetical protein
MRAAAPGPRPSGADDADEGFRQGSGGNEPPYDPMTLQDVFPGLKNEPGLAVPLAPVDSFLGISAAADEANLAAVEGLYARLVKQIRAIDPSWRYEELEPLTNLSPQGRAAVISDLRLNVRRSTTECAATFGRSKWRPSSSFEAPLTKRTIRQFENTTKGL